MLYNIKKKLSKAYTAISSIVVIALLFALQFVVFESNLYFWKDASFWMSLVVMVVILIAANEIYWKNGSTRAERDDKYINSAIEYSVRVNRIKNNNPNLTDDFYKYIDELNITLFIEGRNIFLEEHDILKEDYYYGVLIKKQNTEGNTIQEYTTPHCELTYKQLCALKRTSADGKEELYYTKRQARAITKAVHGKFKYETLNATEILSGIKYKNARYAISYNATKNKNSYALTNLGTTIIFALIGALFGADLAQNGWSVTALFTFLYRIFIFVWRAITSDEAGFRDIADIKRGVNVNRSNITTMYANNRKLDTLFNNIDTEIQTTKTNYLTSNAD